MSNSHCDFESKLDSKQLKQREVLTNKPQDKTSPENVRISAVSITCQDFDI